MMRDRIPLRIGGVVRCCVATLADYENDDGVNDEGTVLPCKYCKSALIVRGRTWEWYREYVPPAAPTPRALPPDRPTPSSQENET